MILESILKFNILHLLRVCLLVMTALISLGCTQSDSGNGITSISQPDGSSTLNAQAQDASEPYLFQQILDFTINLTTTSMTAKFGRFDKNHTCEGRDISPHLQWDGLPPDAKSLALILEDPKSDETNGLWTHWLLYSIPPNVTELETEVANMEVLDDGSKHGINDYKVTHYSGPCPRPMVISTKLSGVDQSGGSHSAQISDERPYYFRLFAVDKEIGLAPGATRNSLLREIDGHVIAAGEAVLPYKTRKRAAKVR